MKLVDWALAYSELGWPVVPISADKKPLVKWRTYQKEPQSAELIESWWEKYPTAGIAIITGEISNLVVVDCDDEIAIAAIAAKGITSSIRATTKRGIHLLFSHPGERVKNQTEFLGLKKVDLRGDGGLFKVYPSRGYTWDLPIGVKVSDIPHELPPFVWNKEANKKDDIDVDLSDVKVEIPDKIDEGRRNTTMLRVVGRLIKQDPALWGVELLQLSWAENLKRCKPPLEQSEIKTITKSVMEMHARNNPDEFDEKGRRKESLLSDLERMVKANIRLMFECDSIGLTGEPPEREWLVKNLIPAGLPGVLASPGGVGKTFLLLDLALKVSCPHPNVTGMFMGHPIVKSGKVVLFLAEDDRHEIMRRLEALDPHYSRIFYPERLVVISVPELDKAINFGTKLYDTPKLTPVADGWYETLTKLDDLALVVFDPLQSFFDWRFDEDNVAADRAMKWAQSIAVRTGAAVIFTHHLRKEDLGPVPTTPQAAVQKIRGASNVVNSARFAIPIWRPTQEVNDEVAEKLGVASNNAIFMAGLGKENFGGDVSTHWLIRDAKTGLLIDRTDEVTGTYGGVVAGRTIEDRVEGVLMDSEEAVKTKDLVVKAIIGHTRLAEILSSMIDSGKVIKLGRGLHIHTIHHKDFSMVVEAILKFIREKSNGSGTRVSMKQLGDNMRSVPKKLLFRQGIRTLVESGVLRIKRDKVDKLGKSRVSVLLASDAASVAASVKSIEAPEKKVST